MYFKLKHLFVNSYQELETQIEEIELIEETDERRSKQFEFDFEQVYTKQIQSLVFDVIQYKETTLDDIKLNLDIIKKDDQVFGLDKTMGQLDTMDIFRVERFQILSDTVTLDLQLPQRLTTEYEIDVYRQQNYSITDVIDMDVIRIKDDGKNKISDRLSLDFYQIFLLYTVNGVGGY